MTMSITASAAIQRRSLDAFFSEAVRTNSDRSALFTSGRYWSYGQLDAECRRIEQVLDAAGLRGKQCNIALIYARSAFSYAAVVAIMRSNCVYVPLNAKAPPQRLMKIIDDACVEAVIIDTSEGLAGDVVEALRNAKALQIIVNSWASSPSIESAIGASPHRLWHVAAGGGSPPEGPNSLTAEPLTSSRLAYIIYTSGSTGVPKGVAISQESACRCIEKLHQMFETGEEDRFTQFSALSFDVSIADLFLCWKSGATLYVPAYSETLVPLQFAASHAITIWSSVPSIANFLLKLQLLKENALPHIRLSLFAGEALPIELAQAWSEAAPRSRIFNLYGPTECTVFATYHEYKSHESPRHGVVPIGVPMAGLRCSIVDDDRIVVGEDAPGELWLSGDQLAVGYWNNPAATQAAFVRFDSAGNTTDVWYRTGDLVSYAKGVGLSFRGRLDRQIKLRGLRVELQEVESVLRDVIGSALVAVVPVRNAGGICEKLVAFCDAQRLDEAMIKMCCLSRLPAYMVPDRILHLESFPLSDHGKIDYKALAERMR